MAEAQPQFIAYSADGTAQQGMVLTLPQDMSENDLKSLQLGGQQLTIPAGALQNSGAGGVQTLTIQGGQLMLSGGGAGSQVQFIEAPQGASGGLGGAGLASSVGQQQPVVLTQQSAGQQPQVLFVDQAGGKGQAVQLPQGVQVVNLSPEQLTQLSAAAQSLTAPQTDAAEEPLYVNAKQYNRILKRRQARAKLDQLGRIPKHRAKYLYDSRHKHAMNRVRGQGGVFVGSAKKDSNSMSETLDKHRRRQEAQEVEDVKPPLRQIAMAPNHAVSSVVQHHMQHVLASGQQVLLPVTSGATLVSHS